LVIKCLERENYEDPGYNRNSYGFSKSITNKLGDKYNKDKGLRNNVSYLSDEEQGLILFVA